MSTIVTKAAAVVEDVETEAPNGAFDVILSAATLDRDGEVIDSRAFEPLPDHITFDIDHGMTVQTTVGSGTPSYDEDGSLRVKGTYASTALAQEVRTLVREGHIRTTSVTFMAAERTQKDGVPHVTSAELLNGTFTPIPSNRESVVLSSKGLAAVTDQKVGARNTLVSLGAACEGKSHAGGEAKAATLTDVPAVTQEDIDAVASPELREYLEKVLAQQATDQGDNESSDTAQSADEAADSDATATESTAELTDEGSEKSAVRLALLEQTFNSQLLSGQ